MRDIKNITVNYDNNESKIITSRQHRQKHYRSLTSSLLRLLTALLMLMKSISLIYSTDGLFCQCLPYIAVRK